MKNLMVLVVSVVFTAGIVHSVNQKSAVPAPATSATAPATPQIPVTTVGAVVSAYRADNMKAQKTFGSGNAFAVSGVLGHVEYDEAGNIATLYSEDMRGVDGRGIPQLNAYMRPSTKNDAIAFSHMWDRVTFVCYSSDTAGDEVYIRDCTLIEDKETAQ
jgi:hypothetical protein